MKQGYIIFILLVLTSISTSVFGQKEYVEIADENYEQKKYTEAIDYYKLALEEKDVVDRYYILQQVARTYKKLFEYKSAIEYYKELTIFKDKNESQNLYAYGQLLRNEERYEEARVVFREYAKRSDSKGDSVYFNALIDYGIEHKKDKDVAKVKRTNLETGNRNLGFSFAPSGLIISAPESKKYEDKTTYYNLAKVEKTSPGIFGEAVELSKNLNSPYYEGTPFIYANGTKILFSSNSADLKKYKPKKVKEIEISEDGRNILKIYSSEFINEKWTEPKELSFNSNNYNCLFPNLNEDGTILYFASDMSGGLGGYDLWKVNKINGSDWSSPENLGSLINTFEDEIYPFSSGSKLYFSSKGHIGIGGYDVYVSNVTNSSYSTPTNIGKPLNSSKDDFSFILENKEGYFSSNREGETSRGFDLVYYFSDYNPFELISGVLKNEETGEFIANAQVNLYKKDTGGNWVLAEELTTQENGEWEFEINPNEEHKVEFIHSDFGKVEREISSIDNQKEGRSRKEDIESLRSIKMQAVTTELAGLVLDAQTGNPIEGVKVIIKELKGDNELLELGSLLTKASGEWSFKIDPKKKYEVSFVHPDTSIVKKDYIVDSYTGNNYEEREQQIDNLQKATLNESNQTELSGVIIDKETNTVLPDVDIVLYRKQDGEWVKVTSSKTNKKGEWIFKDLDPNSEYKAELNKEGFDQLSFIIPDASDSQKRIKVLESMSDVLMSSSSNRGDDTELSGVINDKITNKMLSGVDVILYKKQGGEWVKVGSTKTNEKGEWGFNDLDPISEYKIEFARIGFDNMEFEIPGFSDKGRRFAALESMNNLSMTSSNRKDNVINVDNIYFDFSHSRPKKESYPILDNIVVFMNESPDLTIELSAHTDAVGKDDFNMNLSQSRADRCKDYLVRKGIKSSRIIAKGYGETKILNGCVEWDQCSEEDNQINRRIEIKTL